MNKLFIDALVERMGYEFDDISVNTQDEVRKTIVEMKEYDAFPMICYEHTNDSNFEVEILESKFLNDLSHEGTWIMGINEDEIVFLLNLKDMGKSILEIDTLEVNSEMRGFGIGANIIATIESVAEDFYDKIVVSPFDTDAQNFWRKMEYDEDKNGIFEKEVKYGES